MIDFLLWFVFSTRILGLMKIDFNQFSSLIKIFILIDLFWLFRKLPGAGVVAGISPGCAIIASLLKYPDEYRIDDGCHTDCPKSEHQGGDKAPYQVAVIFIFHRGGLLSSPEY